MANNPASPKLGPPEAVFRETPLQRGLFGANNALYEWVGKDSFYSYLGSNGPSLFDDSLFRDWYCDDNGRPCVLQWRLACACLLQMYDKCSDEEAVERTKYDDRWKVALDLQPGERPFAKSTLQEFRAKLLLNEAAEKVFLGVSLSAAKKFNKFKGPVKVVLDTTPVTGRGAVKDTFNLVGDGIRNLARVLSHCTDEKLPLIIQRYSLSRYVTGDSLKGSANIDWTNDAERRDFLNILVADAQRLLTAAHKCLDAVSEKRKDSLVRAIQLLEKIIAQDTEPDPDKPGKVKITEGTTKGRTVSVTDPEMTHGRKSASKRFDGHKLSTATDPSTCLITAVEVLPGNALDKANSLDLVESTEANTGVAVTKSIGDCAYGDGASRKEYAEEGRVLVAKVPAPPSNQPFHKAHFQVDLDRGCVTCPAGKTTPDFEWVKASSDGTPVKKFFFPLNVCQDCPHKGQCLSSNEPKSGRTVTLHPQEDLIQKAREYQKTPEFTQDMKDRQKAEHNFARMMQRGMRQARYFGLAKTRLQGLMTAALLNLLIVMGFGTHPATVEEALTTGQLECLGTAVPPNGPLRPPPSQTANAPMDLGTQRTTPDGVRGAPIRPGPPKRAPR